MLLPEAADIDDSIRTPYLPQWDFFLSTYVKNGVDKFEFEDGIAFTSCFIQQASLCKLVYSMPSRLMRSHSARDDETAKASLENMHVAITKWHTTLPAKLQWNQWTRDKVPTYVLHLQYVNFSCKNQILTRHSLFFHTIMILLHRPPRHCSRSQLSSDSGGLEVCAESLSTILQILKSYSHHYGFAHLPVTFIHTVATATSVILLRRWLLRNAIEEIEAQLAQMARVVDSLAVTWSVAKHIQRAIKEARTPGGRDSEVEAAPPLLEWEATMAYDEGNLMLMNPTAAMGYEENGLLLSNPNTGWDGFSEMGFHQQRETMADSDGRQLSGFC